MTWLFSPWDLIGFILGSVLGSLATHLTAEDFSKVSLQPTWRFWKSPQQSFIVIFALWALLLFTTIILNQLTASSFVAIGGRDGWQQLLVGSLIGAAAAPWMWLHFARDFGSDAKLREAAKEARIEDAAYKLYLKEGKPEGRDLAHWDSAKKEVEDTEPPLIETSAELQLARYRLVSILLGIALLVVTLLPVLKEWLPRAQQFQAFGISLTLLTTQQSNQDQRLNVSSPSTVQERNRLSDALQLAHRIGASARPSVPTVDQIGPELNDFPDLSIFEKDRAYIAWLTYELPRNGPLKPFLRKLVGIGFERPDSSTLKDYIDGAEDLLKTEYNPPGWTNVDLDRQFVSYSSLISTCFQNYVQDIGDPFLVIRAIAPSLRPFLQETKLDLTVTPFTFQNALSKSLQFQEDNKFCTDEITTLGVNWGPYYISTYAKLKSPYLPLIGALYLAAIGNVESGVFLMEDWIKDFNKGHNRFMPSNNPQLGWYLWRAKWGASTLPYNYHGFVVPHRQLVSWQLDESKQLATMLRLGAPDGWERLCRRLLSSTLHANLGQYLAFLYATERFYLFENLFTDDFHEQEKNNLQLGPLAARQRRSATIATALRGFNLIKSSVNNMPAILDCILRNCSLSSLISRMQPTAAKASSRQLGKSWKMQTTSGCQR